METRAGAGRGSAQPMFAFLAASRPERAGRSSALATGASVVGHALLLTLVGWATMHASQGGDEEPQMAHEHVVDLLPPAVLDRDAAPGAATVKTQQESEARHARYHERSPGSDVVARARQELVRLAPPSFALDFVPPPQVTAVFASLDRSEYSGLGGDSTFSAAEIVADHHDKSAEALASAAPQFTPYTEPPELSNPDQVRRQLSRDYPMYLQDSGIGGRVILWFLVDETGKVRKWLLKESSGHKALDQAALKVAHLMRFRPAKNYDRHVAVWVALPVFFTVDDVG